MSVYCDPIFGICFPDLDDSETYAGMDPLAAAQAYGAAHPGDPVSAADVAAGYQAVQNTSGFSVPAISGATGWLAKNSTAVYAGAGILVLMAMFGGRRR